MLLLGMGALVPQWPHGPISAYEDWPEPGSACDDHRPIDVGQTSHAYTVADELREFEVYVPRVYDPTEPTALVLSFHGLGGSSRSHLANTGWPAVAERGGFVVVSPQGIGDPRGWDYATGPDQAGSDLAFIEDLIDHTERLVCVDPDRRYVSGFSNGSLMAMAVVCKTDVEVAAVGSVGAITSPADCTNDRVVPWIYLHALDDRTVPYLGGPTPVGPLGSVEENLALWAIRSGCTTDPDTGRLDPGIASLTWVDCAGEIPPHAYVLDGLGHVWPHAGLGIDTDAGAMIWAFFQSTQVAD